MHKGAHQLHQALRAQTNIETKDPQSLSDYVLPVFQDVDPD